MYYSISSKQLINYHIIIIIIFIDEKIFIESLVSAITSTDFSATLVNQVHLA